jgi:hypothetical protein
MEDTVIYKQPLDKDNIKKELDDLISLYSSEEKHAKKNGNRRDQWEMYGARQAVRRVKIELGLDY